MINQKPTVFSKLNELVTEKKVDQVCDEGSQDWSKATCVTYLELDNSEAENADDEEYSSSLAIKADAYAKSSSKLSELSMYVVSKMKELGYRRTLYLDVPDPESKFRHKTMRFEKEEIIV